MQTNIMKLLFLNTCKVKLCLILLFITSTSINAQSCLPEGIIFYDQASIDEFSTNYPNCTIIEGNVSIQGSVSNLNGISQIEEIHGSVEIGQAHNLFDLSGLDNLILIEGGLYIFENNNLTNLNGLDNLISTETLHITANINLEDISALNIMEIDNAIAITNNDKLNTLNGLNNILSLSYLLIDGNDVLLDLSGLDNLTTVNMNIDILRNDSLLNLSGLDALTHTGYLIISDNESLQSLNGLEALTTTNGDIYIQLNNQLNDISNLSSLNTVNGSFNIIQNNHLSSLNGLEGLTSINGNLGIGNNFQLSSIEGIKNIDAETITNLYITQNTNLSECAVQSVCDFLNINPANTEIILNAAGCENRQEIENACALGTDEYRLSEIKIFPNPTNGTFEISGLESGTVRIIDSQGRTVKEMISGEVSYSISDLTAGIYFIKITSEKYSVIKQLIKT